MWSAWQWWKNKQSLSPWLHNGSGTQYTSIWRSRDGAKAHNDRTGVSREKEALEPCLWGTQCGTSHLLGLLCRKVNISVSGRRDRPWSPMFCSVTSDGHEEYIWVQWEQRHTNRTQLKHGEGLGLEAGGPNWLSYSILFGTRSILGCWGWGLLSSWRPQVLVTVDTGMSQAWPWRGSSSYCSCGKFCSFEGGRAGSRCLGWNHPRAINSPL